MHSQFNCSSTTWWMSSNIIQVLPVSLLTKAMTYELANALSDGLCVFAWIFLMLGTFNFNEDWTLTTKTRFTYGSYNFSYLPKESFSMQNPVEYAINWIGRKHVDLVHENYRLFNCKILRVVADAKATECVNKYWTEYKLLIFMIVNLT